jgi:glycosyltransferase involved in cell wall biosynthesis
LKVALDAQLAVGTATGIGEYVRGLAKALRASGVEVVELAEPRLDPWRFDRRVYWDQVVLPQRARASGADLLHCASGTMPSRMTMPIVVTVHDMAWLRVQEHARSYARFYFGRLCADRYARAQRVVVDSAFSRAELLQALPELDAARVDVVYPGVAQEFSALERRSGDGKTILAVGTVEPRKNLALLIRTLPRLPDARLIAVGPPTPYATECQRLARDLGVDGRVELRGYVSRDQLLGLYANCAVIAVPSRYEGFGYAAAQALCAGVPLVCAQGSSLDEVVAGDAPSISVDDEARWCELLREGLDARLDARARSVRASATARLGWEASARKMVDIYTWALGGSTAIA